MVKRTKSDIELQILRLLLYNDGMKFTNIMFKANTTHSFLKNRYLPELMGQGYVKRKTMQPIYYITRKGIDFYINNEVARRLLQLK